MHHSHLACVHGTHKLKGKLKKSGETHCNLREVTNSLSLLQVEFS